jgi:hypothetical protein
MKGTIGHRAASISRSPWTLSLVRLTHDLYSAVRVPEGQSSTIGASSVSNVCSRKCLRSDSWIHITIGELTEEVVQVALHSLALSSLLSRLGQERVVTNCRGHRNSAAGIMNQDSPATPRYPTPGGLREAAATGLGYDGSKSATGGLLGALAGGVSKPPCRPTPAEPECRIDDDPGCGFKSFSADTLVEMADGSAKPISEVKIGDEVLATDPTTGERGPRNVTHLWVHSDTLIDLRLDSGAVITTTEDHPFWNATDHQFERADKLDHGDQLLAANGPAVGVLGLSPTHSE